MRSLANVTPRRGFITIIAGLFGASVLSSCALLGMVMDEESGDDAKRGGATELVVDTPVADRVSSWQGDHTDWRVFELPQPTVVTIKIWWDDPDGLDATLLMRGMVASQSRKITHKDGTRIEQIGPLKLPKGKWFIRVQATDGSTVYTVEVKTKGSKSGGGSNLPVF